MFGILISYAKSLLCWRTRLQIRVMGLTFALETTVTRLHRMQYPERCLVRVVPRETQESALPFHPALRSAVMNIEQIWPAQ